MVGTSGIKPSAKPAKDTILIVEDDRGIATLERRRLERAGYAVVCATSAKEGLGYIEQGGVKLVLLDQGLPDITGLEFYERLKASGYDLPVIMVTGLSDEATVVEALRAGVSDFVTKSPEYLDYLPKAVERVVAQARMERRLEESEKRFRELVEHLQVGVILTDPQSKILLGNLAALDLLDFTEKQIPGKTFLDFTWNVVRENGSPFHGEESPVLQAIATGQPVRNVVMGLDRAVLDDRVWLLVNAEPQLDAQGGVQQIICTFSDITERKRMEEALRDSEAFSRSTLNSLSAQIAIVDESGTILAVNKTWRDFAESNGGTGQKVAEGTNYLQVCDSSTGVWSEGAAVFAEGLRSVLSGQREEFTFEYPCHSPTERRWFVARVTRFSAGGLARAVIAHEDITERRRAEERLRYQAFHDSLTNLANRQLFVDRLEQALARAERLESIVAVLFMDLDNFKIVNDSFGHEVGDRLLVAVAERFKSRLRQKDTLARFGGDELVILLEDVEGPTDAGRMAERIIEELRKPFYLNGHEILTSTSIGISLRDSADVSVDEMLRNADTAMYHAKRKDSGSYAVFEPAMHIRILRRLKLEHDLKEAVARGQFKLHYQPLVDIKSGSIIGTEALVRWEHPERGLLSPNEFIPVAEETGLIVPLGKWVLAEACRQACAWRSEFATPLKMNVNLSVRQFQHPDLVEDVAEVLRQTGLEPACLSLEITESVAMIEPERTAAMLRELRELGLRLAIDDFGTGHSSLTYLIRRFRMDILKIDRSFIGEVANDPEYKVIVSGIVGIARGLNLEVVAEGIETAEQYELLQSVGCDMGQGYFFSRPLSGEALSALLSKNPRW